MIKLPRLSALVKFIDPRTGIATRQGSDFWNQMATLIESKLSGVQQNTTTVTDTLQIGANLTLSADGTLSASAGGTSVNISDENHIVVEKVEDLKLFGDVTLTAQQGAEADAYFPPLTVIGNSEVMGSGTAVSLSPVHTLNFVENSRLILSTKVEEYALVNAAPIPSASFNQGAHGGGWLYIEFNAPTSSIPSWVTLGSILENINDCRLYFSNADATIPPSGTLSSGGEGDLVCQILTSPADLIQTFGTTAAGASTSFTFSVTLEAGRLYLAIIDQNVTVPVTLTGGITFDYSQASTMSSSTEPHPTGEIFIGDVTAPGSYTFTASSTGTFSAPGYLGAVLSSVLPSDEITIDIPPTTVWNNAGTQVTEDALAIHAGIGLDATGTSFGTTLLNTGVLGITDGTHKAAGTIELGAGLGLSGTSPDTLSNTGVVSLNQGTLSLTGNAWIGDGLHLSGTSPETLSNSAIVAVENSGTLLTQEANILNFTDGLSATSSGGFTTYQYWRFICSADVASTNTDLAEVVFYSPSGALISNSGGIAGGSYSSGDVPANAFDGNTSTFWEDYVGTATATLTWQFPTAEQVGSISFLPRQGAGWGLPATIIIEGSSDNATWANFGTMVNAGTTNSAATFTLPSPSTSVTVANTGILAISDGTSAANGTIDLGAGLLLSGSTLSAVGGGGTAITLDIGGTLYPDITELVIGSGITATASGTTATSATLSSAGAGGIAKLFSVTTTSGQTSVIFSSIPQTYTHLRLYVVGQSTKPTAYDGLIARVNGDASASYACATFYYLSTGDGYGVSTTTYAPIGVFSDSSSVSNKFGYSIVEIPFYTTALTKSFSTRSANFQNTSSDYVADIMDSTYFGSTLPITELTIIIASGSAFVAGSTLALYGIP
ncbi:MAG: discoidin domain-containing protein [Rhodospirillales bacterium]|nr:discoidin domain-containing protein [Rhodospirillales bacterium]